MRGMILAAGLGSRMGALTQKMPKALIKIAGHYLIEYPLYRLIRAGVREIVINVAHHGEQIKQSLGDGKRYGVNILYSQEEERLETAGGIINALPLLQETFFVISSDIITDYPIAKLLKQPKALAHLVMVDNPKYHPQGDFGLRNHYADKQAKPFYTFANLAVYRKQFFADTEVKFLRLSELLFPAIEKQQITGEYYQGLWHNIGCVDDLKHAQAIPNLSSLISDIA